MPQAFWDPSFLLVPPLVALLCLHVHAVSSTEASRGSAVGPCRLAEEQVGISAILW